MNEAHFAKIRGIAADLFQMGREQITAETSPAQIPAWDSVQHLNLILSVEQEFGLQFEPEEIDQVRSIGRLAALVTQKVGNSR